MCLPLLTIETSLFCSKSIIPLFLLLTFERCLRFSCHSHYIYPTGIKLSLGLPLILGLTPLTDPAVGNKLLKFNNPTRSPLPLVFDLHPIKFRCPQQSSTCTNFPTFLRVLVPPCFVWNQE